MVQKAKAEFFQEIVSDNGTYQPFFFCRSDDVFPGFGVQQVVIADSNSTNLLNEVQVPIQLGIGDSLQGTLILNRIEGIIHPSIILEFQLIFKSLQHKSPGLHAIYSVPALLWIHLGGRR